MSYTVNGIEYKSWSPKNQKIIDKLVNREVYCCVTSELEYMLSRVPYNDKNNPFSKEDYNYIFTESQEIFEWWAITNWFGEKLKEQGCIVIETWGKSYWGRCTTGQSISLDNCVVEIAKKMKVLEGMENEWSVS